MPLCFRENRLSCSRFPGQRMYLYSMIQELSLEKTIKYCYFDRKTCTVFGNCPNCHSMGDLQYIMQHLWKTLIWNRSPQNMKRKARAYATEFSLNTVHEHFWTYCYSLLCWNSHCKLYYIKNIRFFLCFSFCQCSWTDLTFKSHPKLNAAMFRFQKEHWFLSILCSRSFHKSVSSLGEVPISLFTWHTLCTSPGTVKRKHLKLGIKQNCMSALKVLWDVLKNTNN